MVAHEDSSKTLKHEEATTATTKELRACWNCGELTSNKPKLIQFIYEGKVEKDFLGATCDNCQRKLDRMKERGKR